MNSVLVAMLLCIAFPPFLFILYELVQLLIALVILAVLGLSYIVIWIKEELFL